jgi:hexosaminidase
MRDRLGGSPRVLFQSGRGNRLAAIRPASESLAVVSISVIPRPEQVIPGDGIFILSAETTLRVGPGCESIARLLRTSLQPATGLDFELKSERETAATNSSIALVLDDSLPASGYRIEVSSADVKLAGGDPPGLFHATQTLLQLCPPAIFRRSKVSGITWGIPGVKIIDQPRFPWRGMLLDVSRHFFGRESIFTLIDALALHRFNVLHLHLTDDQGWRIEIKRYPRLASIGSWRARSAQQDTAELTEGQEAIYDETPHDGFLSQDDIRELVAYAGERFITIVPEIDIPGHSQAAIAAYPELGNTGEHLPVWTDWGVNPRVLNVENSTLQFYCNVLDEVLKLFPSEFIHIGGDECPKDEWRDSPAAQARMKELGLANEDELQSWLIATFARYLERHGRRLVGWDEILQGGLPAGATVMSWQGTAGGITAAEAGHDVIMTPESYTYLYRRQTDDPGTEPRGAEPPLYLSPVPRCPPTRARCAVFHVDRVRCLRAPDASHGIPPRLSFRRSSLVQRPRLVRSILEAIATSLRASASPRNRRLSARSRQHCGLMNT